MYMETKRAGTRFLKIIVSQAWGMTVCHISRGCIQKGGGCVFVVERGVQRGGQKKGMKSDKESV